jgi:hypothetical protein
MNTCTLANPVPELELRLNQYNSLSIIAGDKISYEVATANAIPVELASLEGLLKSLPMSFSVTCPSTNVPTSPTPQTLAYIKKLCEPEDLIAEAIYNTYIGLCTDVI